MKKESLFGFFIFPLELERTAMGESGRKRKNSGGNNLCLLVVLALLEWLGDSGELGQAVDLTPGEESVDVLPGGLVVHISDLGELVGLVVGAVSDLKGHILTTEDEDAVDLVVVVLTEDTKGAEGVLAGGLEALEEAAEEVAGHVDLLVLLVVLVLGEPDGVTLKVDVLPEELDGVLLVAVGHGALPALKVELRGWQGVEWVGALLLLLEGLLLLLLLLLLGGLLLLLLLLLGSGGLLLLLLLLLLSGGSGSGSGLGDVVGIVNGGLLSEGDLPDDSLELGLVDEGGEVAGHVDEGGTELGVEDLEIADKKEGKRQKKMMRK